MAGILKPWQKEGHVHLTPRQRREVRLKLFRDQGGICGCGCGRRMTLELGLFHSATLEHKKPQPAGCKKDDSLENLSCWAWVCNFKKGSKRS